MSEPSDGARRQRDRPWIFRTYAGHSTAHASNALYRNNLGKGQTGLSVAFDLPTQTGYDSDHPLAKGEVGKVGVPISHLGDMRTLFDQIPLGEMNTSMTINATAAWLLALYVTLADEQGVARNTLQGTTQNDIIKEYLSRGTHVFPPAPSMRLIADMVAFTVNEIPKWNPINICSYHLQEAGATPVQELAYGLATAVGVLDAVRDSGQIPADEFPEVVGRISFFIDVGTRFVEEMCKMRAFTQMWDRICRERYGVTDEKLRRFRYGVQVNSLGLTEAQPENNVQRIVLEMLGVTLSRDARARAIQLPCWNEALGLPRPWDQQWSLRMQQVLAYESDLLEYGDLFEGSKVVEAKVAELVAAASEELDWVLEGGGAFAMIDEVKGRLVQSNAERVRAILGEQTGLAISAPADPFEAQAARDALVEASGALKTVAVSLTKIANDIRLMGSGPRAGLAEIALPELQKGSSIMPGKVNPVIPEVVTQVSAQVIGNDAAITVGGMQGHFELNVFVPLLARNLLQSIHLLTSASRLFAEKCVDGIEANREFLAKRVRESVTLVTALNPLIGYEKAALIAKTALATGGPIDLVAESLGIMTRAEMEALLVPENLTQPVRLSAAPVPPAAEPSGQASGIKAA